MNVIKVVIPLLLCGALLAQEFDVATIKPGDPASIAKSFRFTRGGGLEIKGATLKNLIVTAYNPNAPIEGGPPWAAVDRYDVTAKNMDGEGDRDALTEAEREKYLEGVRVRARALLASRFKLIVHKEVRELPIYELHVDKNGPKPAFKEADSYISFESRWDTIFSKGAEINALTGVLSNVVGRPVMDKTGLTGRFSDTLRWALDQTSPGGGIPNSDTSNFGSVFTALREQLGLRLDRDRAPMEVLVIDRAERPSEN